MQLQINENEIIVDGVKFIPENEIKKEEIKTNNIESDILKHENLINLIKHFEDFEPKAYVCEGGKWTIGYGTTIYANGKAVKEGETITLDKAIIEMNREIEEKAQGIAKYIKVPLNPNQLDALVSFAYNVGLGNFQKSTLLKKLNNGDYAAIPNELMKWINASGKPWAGLWRRRLAEALLFQGITQVPKKYDKNFANIKYFPTNWKNYL